MSDKKEQERVLFPRGSGPLVSVLIPSRGRAAELVKAVDSLYSLAWDTKHIEVIVKADEDDTQTIVTAEKIKKFVPLELVVTPRGNGYADLGLWYNLLASKATGDWLFVYNDDAKMLTQNWDYLLSLASPCNVAGSCGIQALGVPIKDRPNSCEFLMVRRLGYEILGYLAKTPFVDTWIFSTYVMIGAFDYFEGVQVEHMGPTMTDRTAAERKVICDRMMNPLCCSAAAIMGKMSDALKLAAYVETKNPICSIGDWIYGDDTGKHWVGLENKKKVIWSA